MSEYKGLFTFDADNHRYVPVEQADGIISDMDYHPESEEEPKEYWTIDLTYLGVAATEYKGDDVDLFNKSIGNYFESREEARLALRKLKAWKRLKDDGAKIVGWDYSEDVDLSGTSFNDDVFIVGLTAEEYDQDDLDLLFSGETD